jgi:hypothetical protein
MDDQPVVCCRRIKDGPVVSHEIDSATELALYLGWISPLCFGGNREPRADRSLRIRVTPQKSFIVRRVITCIRKSYHVTNLVTTFANLRQP